MRYQKLFFITLILSTGLLPQAAFAATLSLAPAEGSVAVGSTITETVMVSSSDQAMNAIEGNLSFSSDLLQVISISKGGSVLSLWVQDPTFSNTNGSISFSGVVPNPGYTGGRTQVVSIQFRAKKAGTATISFTPSAQVLANDGNGTDITANRQSATIRITAGEPIEETPVAQPTSTPAANLLARITSSTHPVETNWYALSHASFDWTNDSSVTAIRLGYDKNADGKPTVVYTEPISHKELDLTDGIWYFHVQERGRSGWGPVSSFRVQVDTASPLPFNISFLTGATTQEGNPVSARFTATDELSGIDRYEVTLDDQKVTLTAEEGSSPYAIEGMKVGVHTLSVIAYDKAGNMTKSGGQFTVAANSCAPSSFFAQGWLAINYLTILLILLAILATLFFGAWYIRTHFSAYRQHLRHRLGLTNVRVHKEFDKLRDALGEELAKLDRAQTRRALTRNEQRITTRFKELLEESEIAIEKDIEDTAN